MTEAEQDSGNALVLAHTGEVVDLSDERQIATAYSEIYELEAKLKEALRRMRVAMNERAKVLGSKTFYLEGIGKVEVKGATVTEFPDPIGLKHALLEVDCPEDVVAEIVKATIEYKVDQKRANQAAAANSRYKAVIDRFRVVTERIPSVQIT